jgi:Carboxypeptidase regulatory-like domain
MAVCFGLSQPLVAQAGVISGQVLADKTERPIANARIELRATPFATRSDSAGRFQLKDIAAGDYVVVIRAIGYDSLVANVRLAARDAVDADFLMTSSVQTLAAVKVEADGSLDRLRLAEFDERRALGQGRFLDRGVFEKNAASQVDVVIIGRVPGLRSARVAGKTVLTSSRSRGCYPQVIVNGISVWNGMPGGPDVKRNVETMLFDVNMLRNEEIIGFEWHNPASTPLKYNATSGAGGGSFCGTAIFWTK